MPVLLCLAAPAFAQDAPAAARDSLRAGQTAPARDSLRAKAAAADSLMAAKTPEKEPFWKTWFGSLDLKGGTTAVFPSEATSLKDNRGLLFNSSALFSTFSDLDQITVALGGDNTNETARQEAEEGDASDSSQGLKTLAGVGVDYFTTRLKDIESTVGVNYKYTGTRTGSLSERNAFQEEEFMNSTTSKSGNRASNAVTMNGELKREKGKTVFHLKPLLRYTNTRVTSSSEERTMSGIIEYEQDEEWQRWQEEEARWREEEKAYMDEEEWQRWNEMERRTRLGWAYYANNSTAGSTENANDYKAEVNADLTLRELAGKKGRELRLGMNAGYDAGKGTADEASELWTSAGDYQARAMHYDAASSASRLGGSVVYTEPIGQDWTLTATADIAWSHSGKVRDASDADGHNDLFSSESRANTFNQQYDLTAQYKINPQSLVSFGGRLSSVLNETWSKSKGVEDTTGEGDWNWFLTPTARYQFNKGNDRISVVLSGNSKRPGLDLMLPVLDLRMPSRPGIGNIYLKPYSSSNWNTNWTRNDKSKQSSLSVSLQGSLIFNQINYARWYDDAKVLYSVPVNARKPGLSTSLKAAYSTPLDAARAWTLTVSGGATYNTSVSYQAVSLLPGIDRKAFDYTAFMESFWGDADGSTFYGGGSGFQESNTQTFVPTASAGIKFTRESYKLYLGANTTGRISRYSLNPAVNLNTLDTRLYASGEYTSPHKFYAMSSFACVFYTGYAEDFGLPEYQWNAEVGKKIKDFTLSFKAFDILNQTRSLTHAVAANYEEDTYRLTMGRYFLLGVKWDFGKSDAPHLQRSRSTLKALGL